jgi:uncharacterized membrane protein YphA (DoxX/SURF4 family)
MSRHLVTAGRILLGFSFIIFGSNYFLGFLPMPPPPPGPSGEFLGALAAGHVLTVAKLTQIAAGTLLLSNRYVPLALVLLAPVLVGIVLFHAVFDPAGLGMPLVLVGLEVALAWSYRDAFAPVLRARVESVASQRTSGSMAAAAAP